MQSPMVGRKKWQQRTICSTYHHGTVHANGSVDHCWRQRLYLWLKTLEVTWSSTAMHRTKRPRQYFPDRDNLSRRCRERVGTVSERRLVEQSSTGSTRKPSDDTHIQYHHVRAFRSSSFAKRTEQKQVADVNLPSRKVWKIVTRDVGLGKSTARAVKCRCIRGFSSPLPTRGFSAQMYWHPVMICCAICKKVQNTCLYRQRLRCAEQSSQA